MMRILSFALVVAILLPIAAHAQNSNTVSIAWSHLLLNWPWYLVRASGLVAALCLFILTLSGIGMITGSTFKFLEPITAWATHSALGITLAISVLVHIFTLLLDHYIGFNLRGILVPFATNYQSVTLFDQHLGSLYVAMGIIAFYLLLLIIITSLTIIGSKARLWKSVHFLTYAVVVLVFFHSLYSGTDLKDGLPRLTWIVAGIGAIIAVFARLYRAGTLKRVTYGKISQ